jgi:hypothetical protein
MLDSVEPLRDRALRAAQEAADAAEKRRREAAERKAKHLAWGHESAKAKLVPLATAGVREALGVSVQPDAWKYVEDYIPAVTYNRARDLYGPDDLVVQTPARFGYVTTKIEGIPVSFHDGGNYVQIVPPPGYWGYRLTLENLGKALRGEWKRRFYR